MFVRTVKVGKQQLFQRNNCTRAYNKYDAGI